MSENRTETLGEKIREKIKEIIARKYKISSDIPIPEVPKNLQYGELFTDVAFRLAHVLRASPREIACDLCSELSEFGADEKNGFINFKIPSRVSLELLRNPKISYLRGKRTLCEFVSANPTGPLHVGHGRIAAVGDAISRILRFCGADVTREFYINDAGEQIEKLGLAILGTSEEYKSSYTENIKIKLKTEFKNITETENNPDLIGLMASRMILQDIRATLERFGLNFDSWVSEREISSGYFDRAVSLMREHLYHKDGALFLKTTAFGDDKDRVVIKSDGRPTYFGNDCAYHLYKVERNFDELVQVWGADHHGYIRRIDAALKIFGFKGKFVVKLVQMVNLLKDGVPIQMSKREGIFVSLDELIDEVGADAARFIYLTRVADSHLDFDIEVAKKKSMENPVFYVQYAHARTCSLFREAIARGLYEGYETWKENISRSQISLSEKERKLLALCAVFYDVVLTAAKTYEPSIVANFLLTLAREFHSYYQAERILTDEQNTRFSRLLTCEIVQQTSRTGLELLGVSAPERM